MEDLLLKKFFEKERWNTAIETARVKGINKAELRALCTPQKRIELLVKITTGQYEIAPPHQALIQKDDGSFRTVYVNEGMDRIFLSIVNDMLFELCPEMVHKACTSYQKGIGCGKVVQHVSVMIGNGTKGWKADLSKYFDSVPIKFIDSMFDKVEEKWGHSAIIDVLRKYYHADLCFTPEGKLISHYQSLKQGCAVASFLADALLYHIDEKLSKLNGFYVRYSDDTLFIGKDYHKAMVIMERELNLMGLKLNPKKVEYLSSNKWFKFLGFNIKGHEISLSKGRLETLSDQIKRCVAKCGNIKSAVNNVNRYLYVGNGEHSWAGGVLAIVNNMHDINVINGYIMDAIRSAGTGKRDFGSLGCNTQLKDGCVQQGTGRNVAENRRKIPYIKGYLTLQEMRNAMLYNRDVYNAVVLNMFTNVDNKISTYYPPDNSEHIMSEIKRLYAEFRYSVPSEWDSRKHYMFWAEDVNNLTTAQMIYGKRRGEAAQELENYVVSNIRNGNLKWNPSWGNWYYHDDETGLVLLKGWWS